MSEDKKYGRENIPVPPKLSKEPSAPLLSDADRARIRAEEEYRAQVRREEAAKPPPTKKELEQLKRQQTARETEEQQTKLIAAQEKERQRRTNLSPEARAKEDKTNMGCAAAIVVAFVLLLLWLLRGCFVPAPPPPPLPPPPPPPALSAASPTLVREYCLDAVRDKLKSPSSAEFNAPTVPVFKDNLWLWDSYVEAQNAFGVQLKTSFACVVDGADAEHLSAFAVVN